MSLISPLDDRYAPKLTTLNFTEKTLNCYRVKIECAYLQKLCDTLKIKELTFKEKQYLKQLCKLNSRDLKLIKKFEIKTNHDVKAVEYFIKSKLEKTSLSELKEFVHFALTSEDINNIAYALMIKTSLKDTVILELNAIQSRLNILANQYSNVPLLGRTHGQPAVTTTFGKEFRVFEVRLSKQIKKLKQIKIEAKLNGAVGNYNAHIAAYPKINWLKFSKKFIRSFDLIPNLTTTQIEPHDSYAEVCDTLKRINSILIGLCQDMWYYTSVGLITQKTEVDKIGSSTMPQKVNPIHFENAEGNLGMSNALLEFFSKKLLISRLQRDLSDSTVMRNFGVVFGHGVVAYTSITSGLDRIDLNTCNIYGELAKHSEVVTEGIQTILRREGVEKAYEKLHKLAQSTKIDLAAINKFINTLNESQMVKDELKNLSPFSYVGLAKRIARGVK